MSTPTTTFTPSPWERDGRTIYALQPDSRKDGQPIEVNRFSAHFQPGVLQNGTRTPDGELEADASLSAAAPDLYDALNGIVDWDADIDSGQAELKDRWRRLIAAALTALAKAKGCPTALNPLIGGV